MALPFFYQADLSDTGVVLDEDTSKHITGVLRKKVGDALVLTNGQGTRATARITNDHRKRCEVRIEETQTEAKKTGEVCTAISLLKAAPRFEWFLEKSTELGVSQIIPLLCQRTERQAFRAARLQQILISAMLQSQQVWLPQLHAPTAFENVIETATQPHRFIAHCLPHQKQTLAAFDVKENESTLMLIGPEGDFTESEIEAALQKGFAPVALGNTRLRTETAGLAAATLLCLRH